MCGIVGKLHFDDNKIISKTEIKKMSDTLTHRGPDDSGIFVDKNIGLGHRRLSIIDLSRSGRQPMPDIDNRFWIVFNGEIYNFLEIRKNLARDGIKFKSKTDTEVIIYLYKKFGAGCLEYLNGMFAFAIWDIEKKELFLARDRVGKKPLKYYFDNNIFIFASELKAILKNSEVKREIDFSAIDEYLTYQYVPHPKTGFKKIHKLPPAHYLIIKPGGEIIKKKYWQLDYSKKLNLSEQEWKNKILSKLKQSVKLRMISDVPIGAHLSGGIDSSLIVALMAKQSKKQIATFSIGFKESDYNELPFAKLVAEKYGTKHYEFIIEPNALKILPKLAYQYEEPFADSSAIPTWHLSELTKKYATVALNGDGGDENFAGYSRYNAVKFFYQIKILPFKKQMKFLNKYLYNLSEAKIFRKGYNFLKAYDKNPITFYLQIIDYFNQKEKESIYNDEFKNKINSSRWHSFIEHKFNEAKKFNQLDQILYTDINSYLPDDLLVKTDIASMAHGLEVRSPLLDYELLELSAQMPSNLKLKRHNKKYILKQIAYDYLPKKCIDRPKQGFGVPLEYWFRGELSNYLKKELLNKNFLNYGFRKDGIEKIISEHQSKKQNYASQLWALLFLNEWFKVWFK